MKNERIVKITGTALTAVFAVMTFFVLFADGQPDRLVLAAGTVFLVMLPAALEKVFCCRVRLPVYIFALLYAIGPMLGHCWYLYYMISWWDKLLESLGALVTCLLLLFDKGRHSLVEGLHGTEK